MPRITIDIDQETLDLMRTQLRAYDQFVIIERETGKAPIAIFDLEDVFGGYLWLVEKIIEADSQEAGTYGTTHLSAAEETPEHGIR